MESTSGQYYARPPANDPCLMISLTSSSRARESLPAVVVITCSGKPPLALRAGTNPKNPQSLSQSLRARLPRRPPSAFLNPYQGPQAHSP